MPPATRSAPAVPPPRGYLDFKAIRTKDNGRVVYTGVMPVFDLIDQNFITPVASKGLTEEVLEDTEPQEPVQRKTNAPHVQAILDYIVEEAEAARPWAFGAIVLYSKEKLDFEVSSVGHHSAGEARATSAFSVGEGLHRCLAWAVALGNAKVRGVKRPEMSAAARARIEQAAIPVLVIEEPNLKRQRNDFHRLNRQKPLTPTVLTLTDDSPLSELTKSLIHDVALFDGRIDLNNATVGVKSDKLLSFAQLRFVIASYLLGRATRSKQAVEDGVAEIVEERGKQKVQAELKRVFGEVASKLGDLERLQNQPAAETGDLVRQIRSKTLLASNAAWRALFVALHEAQEQRVPTKTAIARVQEKPRIWSRKGRFFLGSLIDRETGKLLSNRESIDAASDRLRDLMLAK